MTKKGKNHLLVALITVVVEIVAIRFLLVTVQYAIHSDEIHYIEQTAQEGIWTENGKEHWSESMVSYYDDAIQRKQDFIASSDIAAFMYYSAFSKIGQLIRFMLIFVCMGTLCISTIYLYRYIRHLIRCLIRYQKRLKRRLMHSRR